MKKILLVCDLGMSTSLVVKRMQEAAAKRELDVEIQAKGISDFKNAINNFDCALLGPQNCLQTGRLQTARRPA